MTLPRSAGVLGYTRLVSLLVATACVINGCRAAKMPSPVVFHDGRVDPCNRIPQSERTTKVQVFYATSRGANSETSEPKYSNAMSDDLRVGVATVQLGGDEMTFEQLCAVSRGQETIKKLPLSIVEMRETARLSKLSDSPSVDGFTADE